MEFLCKIQKLSDEEEQIPTVMTRIDIKTYGTEYGEDESLGITDIT